MNMMIFNANQFFVFSYLPLGSSIIYNTSTAYGGGPTGSSGNSSYVE